MLREQRVLSTAQLTLEVISMVIQDTRQTAVKLFVIRPVQITTYTAQVTGRCLMIVLSILTTVIAATTPVTLQELDLFYLLSVSISLS
jgi:hypothetical protein